MYTLAARRGTFLLVVILLLISILLEQAIAALFPWLGRLGGVRPMIVFLDIPLATPFTIDWIPVGFLFIAFYGLVSPARNNVKPKGEIRRRGWAILGRWWLLLIFLLASGGLYYGISGFLPKEVRNGLDSFGMRADLVLPYPSGETIHLQGSMIMLAFFVWGWRLLISSALPPAPAAPPPRIAMQIPDPVEIKRPVVRKAVPEPMPPLGRTCVHVAMPESLQRRRRSFPCVVEGGIEPVSRKARQVAVTNAL